MDFSEFSSDWKYILSLMPENWKVKFNELNVLKFGRKFTGNDKEEKFLQIMFMHLACGYSFRSTVEQAKAGKLVDICDVTLFHHFKKCKDFFKWCVQQLVSSNRAQFHDLFGNGKTWIAVDGTVVREQGITGSLHRIHYSINLNDLSVNDVKITSSRIGESFAMFDIIPGGVYLGDRGFAKQPGIAHVVKNGGHVLCRFSPTFLKMHTPDNGIFPLMKRLHNLNEKSFLDEDVVIGFGENAIHGRVCAVKRGTEATAREVAHIKRSAQLKSRIPSKETIMLCEYLLIFTTLPRENYSAETIVHAYRLRWQIEIVFKRLKSLLGLGQLHKYDPDSVETFLAGKLLLALLLEKMNNQAEDFSPL